MLVFYRLHDLNSNIRWEDCANQVEFRARLGDVKMNKFSKFGHAHINEVLRKKIKERTVVTLKT